MLVACVLCICDESFDYILEIMACKHILILSLNFIDFTSAFVRYGETVNKRFIQRGNNSLRDRN